MGKRFRAGVIGATGHGDYGHSIELAFRELPNVDVVALADADPKGRASAAKRAGARATYADYHEMLAKERLDVVAIGPRQLSERVAMATAAANAGCHIFTEKPIAASLEDADAILDACQRKSLKIAVAHQMRGMPTIRKAYDDFKAGKFGKLVRLRARGKEDPRGGGEDMLVLGSHLFDLMHLFAGPPEWISGHVTVGGRPITLADARPATEPIGPVAGDDIATTIGFGDGVFGFFESRARVGRPGKAPYGLLVECEEATVAIRSGEVFIYPASVLVPENADLAWKKAWVEDWHFTPEHQPRPRDDMLHRGNRILTRDLLESVGTDREPITSGANTRWTLEVVSGTYASSLAGGARLPLPLKERAHPLGKLSS